MDWSPIPEDMLRTLIDEGHSRMDGECRTLWERIRITPEKWQLSPWGDLGGGFWVVGRTKSFVVWYNDIEEGFNHSTYAHCGAIDEYCCNQDPIEYAICTIIHSLPNRGAPLEL